VCSQNEERDGFLLLSGCEYGVSFDNDNGSVVRNGHIYINGIGFDSPPEIPNFKENDVRKTDYAVKNLPTQEIIDAINAAGGIAYVNHPAWCRNLVSDIQNLKGLAGIEIYNSNTAGYGILYDDHSKKWDGGTNENCAGYAGFYIDQLALMGINAPVFAFDDCHSYFGEEGRSFIMVQAEELTRGAILDGIKNRRFYATQGPWVYVECKDRVLTISCTPVKEIRVFSNASGGWSLSSKYPITGTEYRLPDEAFYYRVEITGENGRQAWTSPAEVH
jgi:hypothetical protein